MIYYRDVETIVAKQNPPRMAALELAEIAIIAGVWMTAAVLLAACAIAAQP